MWLIRGASLVLLLVLLLGPDVVGLPTATAQPGPESTGRVSAGGGGCATARPTIVEPPFNYSFIGKIGVVRFSETFALPGTGKIVADRIEQILLEKSPYKVVARMELEQVLKEHNLSASGVLDPKSAVQIGLLTGVDALVVGNVESYDLNKPRHESGGTTWTTIESCSVVVTFKVLNAKTGDIAWSRTSRGKASYSAYDTKGLTDAEAFEAAMADGILKDALLLFPSSSADPARTRPPGPGISW